MKFFAVMLISYVVIAQECEADKLSGPGRKQPIECYECSTYAHDEYCADPFNATHPNAKTLLCDGACAKWVRKPKVGPMHYVRTCEHSLNIGMPIYMVCMKESRPGNGKLCFCHRDKCNGASALAQASTLRWLLLVLVAVSVSSSQWFGGKDAEVLSKRRRQCAQQQGNGAEIIDEEEDIRQDCGRRTIDQIAMKEYEKHAQIKDYSWCPDAHCRYSCVVYANKSIDRCLNYLASKNKILHCGAHNILKLCQFMCVSSTITIYGWSSRQMQLNLLHDKQDVSKRPNQHMCFVNNTPVMKWLVFCTAINGDNNILPRTI